MVALAAFTIDPRDDARDLKAFQAEGYAANISTVQAAASQYITPFIPNPASYSNGIIPVSSYSAYLPPGFNQYNYVRAEIFCINPAASLTLATCSASTHNYLVTYATSLGRFEGSAQTLPSYAVRKALAEMTGYTYSAGLVVKASANTDSGRDALNSVAGIMSMQGIGRYLPLVMLKANGGTIDYGDFVYVTKLSHSDEVLPSP